MAKSAKVWEPWEDELIMTSPASLKELAAVLQRTAQAISTRRSILNRTEYYSAEEREAQQKEVENDFKKKKDFDDQIKEYAGAQSFSKEQLNVLKLVVKKGVSIEKIADARYSPMQLKELFYCVRDGLDVSWAKPEYNFQQMKEIRLGLQSNIDTSWYRNTEYSCEAMRQIRYGLEANLDVRYYANPSYNFLQMQQIRECLRERLPVWRIANPRYSANQIKVLRKALKTGTDITSFSDPTLSAEEMNRKYNALYAKYRAVYKTASKRIPPAGVSLAKLNSREEPFVIHCRTEEQSKEFLRKMEDLGYSWGELKTNSTGKLSSICFYCNPKSKRLYSNNNKPKTDTLIHYMSLDENYKKDTDEADLNEEECWVSCTTGNPRSSGLYLCLERDKETKMIQERLLDYRRDDRGALHFITSGTVLAWKPHSTREELSVFKKKNKKTIESEQETAEKPHFAM